MLGNLNSRARRLAAALGLSMLALTFAPGAVQPTQAEWNDTETASAMLKAATLHPVESMDCLDERDNSLLGLSLLNTQVRLRWLPGLDAPPGVVYDVRWTGNLLSPAGSDTVLYPNSDGWYEHTYRARGLSLGLTTDIYVRPRLGDWVGDAIGYSAATLGVLLPVRVACDELLLDGIA